MKDKIYYSYGKSVLFTSLAAVALSLAASNLDTVKAANLTASRSALHKSTKTKKKTARKADKVDKISSAAEAESPAEIKQDQATDQEKGNADSVTVKAHYVNQKGEQIAPDETLTGKLNDPYPDKEIAGYEIVTKPKGQFSATEPEITYVYANSSTQTEEAAVQDSQAKIAPRSIINIKWSGLKLTFDTSTGLLTIPGGTVNNPEFLSFYVSKQDVKKIKFAEPLKITGKAHFMFAFLENLTEIEGLEKLDTSEVTSMWGMFNDCQSLTSLDVSGFNTDNVENMYNMFRNCRSLTSLDVSGFNTAKVANMSVMFSGCSSLTSLDLSSFKITSATIRDYMLNGLSQLNTLILGEDNNLNGVALNTLGIWANVGKGTLDRPEGSKKWKSAELTANYNGQTDHDTYVRLMSVIAHYIDQNTKEAIIPDATMTGKIGNPYPDQPLEGYVQVSKPKGTFSDSEKQVTYVYTKTVSPGKDPTVPGTDPAVKGATVTVHYQDAKGNPLAPDEILSGKVGEGYVSTAKTIAGYELVNRPKNATGFFSQNLQSVTYIYAPVESNSSKQPGQNNQTGGGSNNNEGNNHASHGKGKQPHNDHANSKNKQQTGRTAPVQLAQTGSAEKEQAAALTLGSLSLLGGLIGSWFSRRKKERLSKKKKSLLQAS